MAILKTYFILEMYFLECYSYDLCTLCCTYKLIILFAWWLTRSSRQGHVIYNTATSTSTSNHDQFSPLGSHPVLDLRNVNLILLLHRLAFNLTQWIPQLYKWHCVDYLILTQESQYFSLFTWLINCVFFQDLEMLKEILGKSSALKTLFSQVYI